MTFKKWITKLANVDLPVNEFAAFVRDDNEFPEEANYDYILKYLENKNADALYIEFFKLYFNAYFNEPCK